MMNIFTTPRYIVGLFNKELSYQDNLFNPENTRIENNTIIDNIEKIRYSLLSLKDEGRYTGEIQQAVIYLEQAMLNIDHYNKRRFMQFGSANLPIPEDPTEYFKEINNPKYNTLIVNFYVKDWAKQAEPKLFRTIEINQPNASAINLPILYGYLLAILKKEGKFFIEEKTDDVITVGVILDTSETYLSLINRNSKYMLNYITVDEFLSLISHLESDYYRENNLIKNHRCIQIVDVTQFTDDVVNKYKDKGLEKDNIIQIDLPESIDPNRDTMYYIQSYQDIRDKLASELGLFFFGHPNYPGILFTFNPSLYSINSSYVENVNTYRDRLFEYSDNIINQYIDTQREYKNAVTQIVNKVLEENLQRSFVK